MQPSQSERLTAQFYEWEQRGRGWHVFDDVIDIEPQFYPFFGHKVPAAPVSDDGTHPSIFGRVANLFRTNKKPAALAVDSYYDIPEVEAYKYDSEENHVAIGVILPRDQKIESDEIEHLLLMLSITERPLSFEIVASEASITLQFVCTLFDAPQVAGQIKAYFPNAIVSEKPHEALDIFIPDQYTCVIELGLSDEFMRPLALATSFDPDPFIGLFGMLEYIGKGERGAVQVLFKGTVNPWAESIMRAVTDGSGGSFFEDAPDMVKLAREKVSSPLYAVCIRAIGQGDIAARSEAIAGGISTALIQLTKSHNNALIPLTLQGYDIQDLHSDVLFRQSHRLGMILNSQELATLVHFPTPAVLSAKVERDTKKTKAAPESAQGASAHSWY